MHLVLGFNIFKRLSTNPEKWSNTLKEISITSLSRKIYFAAFGCSLHLIWTSLERLAYAPVSYFVQIVIALLKYVKCSSVLKSLILIIDLIKCKEIETKTISQFILVD